MRSQRTIQDGTVVRVKSGPYAGRIGGVIWLCDSPLIELKLYPVKDGGDYEIVIVAEDLLEHHN